MIERPKGKGLKSHAEDMMNAMSNLKLRVLLKDNTIIVIILFIIGKHSHLILLSSLRYKFNIYGTKKVGTETLIRLHPNY